MLLSVRRSACLKDNFYYNSCPESMKNCMKKDIDNQKKAAGPGKSLKCSCTEFSDIAEKFVGKYCRNAYRAIVGDSPYTPAPSYRQLEIIKEEWDQLSKTERIAPMDNFSGLSIQQERNYKILRRRLLDGRNADCNRTQHRLCV